MDNNHTFSLHTERHVHDLKLGGRPRRRYGPQGRARRLRQIYVLYIHRLIEPVWYPDLKLVCVCSLCACLLLQCAEPELGFCSTWCICVDHHGRSSISLHELYVVPLYGSSRSLVDLYMCCVVSKERSTNCVASSPPWSLINPLHPYVCL